MKSKFSIIPVPSRITENDGFFRLNEEFKIFSKDFDDYKFPKLSVHFEMHWKEALSENDANILLVSKADLKKDAYILNVEQNGIKISSSTKSGAFYALQTLAQIIKTENGFTSVPCCEIYDYPRFEWRGFMLDESRHFLGKEFVKQTLDMMALNKMNIFHWHLTDDQGWRIEIKKYPFLTIKGSIRKSTPINIISINNPKKPRDNAEYGKGLYYTQEDISEIVDYASERFIDIVPEIDMPGHLSAAIACYPELSCSGEKIDVAHEFGVLENIACCGKDNIYRFAYDIIDEMTMLFPFKYIHIGGDEVPKGNWKKCPHCQDKIKNNRLGNEEDLQGYFNNCLQAYIGSKGRYMIGWNEILKASELNKSTVIQWWCEDSGRVRQWIESGNKAILSKLEYLYMDHLYGGKPLSKTYSFDLDKMGLSDESEKNILGIEAPLWTEYVRNAEKAQLNMYPRLQAVAEIAWSVRENRNYDSFLLRLEAGEMLMDGNNIFRAKRKVYEPDGFKAKVRKINDKFNFRNKPNCEIELNK